MWGCRQKRHTRHPLIAFHIMDFLRYKDKLAVIMLQVLRYRGIYSPIPILFLPFPALSTEIYENSYYVLST